MERAPITSRVGNSAAHYRVQPVDAQAPCVTLARLAPMALHT